MKMWKNPHHEATCPMQGCSIETVVGWGGDGDVRCKGCEHNEHECHCDTIYDEQRQAWLANVDKAWSHLFSALGQGRMYLRENEKDLIAAAEITLRTVQNMNGGREGIMARRGKANP